VALLSCCADGFSRRLPSTADGGSEPPCVSCVQTPSRSLPACVCVLGAARLKLVGLVAWAILLSCCRLCCVGHACLFHQTLPPLSGASIAPLGTDLLGVGAWVSCSLGVLASCALCLLVSGSLSFTACVCTHVVGRATLWWCECGFGQEQWGEAPGDHVGVDAGALSPIRVRPSRLFPYVVVPSVRAATVAPRVRCCVSCAVQWMMVAAPCCPLSRPCNCFALLLPVH